MRHTRHATGEGVAARRRLDARAGRVVSCDWGLHGRDEDIRHDLHHRRATMLMRKLGRTGLRVAALCLGGNTFGWTTDQKASGAVLDAYVEAGGNFIDTADVYARWAAGNHGGESETVMGRWFKARGQRHDVVVATKVCGPMGPGPNDKGLSRHHIMAGVEDSLRR